jgi:hypothetical protein
MAAPEWLSSEVSQSARDLIEAEVKKRFTQPQRFPKPPSPSDYVVVPIFQCEGISSDTDLQSALIHIVTELADMLMLRDALKSPDNPDPLNQMQCPIFRITRSISAWILAARDIVGADGPFGHSVSAFMTPVRSVPATTGMTPPTTDLLKIIVSTAFEVRKDLTGVSRNVGDVPRVDNDRKTQMQLVRTIMSTHRSSERQSRTDSTPRVKIYTELKAFVAKLFDHDKLDPDIIARRMKVLQVK